MDFPTSKTRENLLLAFANECTAFAKYTIGADQADKEGNARAKIVFTTTATNEMEHLQQFYKLLHNNATPSVDKILEESIAAENYENTDFYLQLAQTADEEGFHAVAMKFREIADIEGQHRNRFVELMTPEVGMVDTVWRCTKCGHEWQGEIAPAVCPVCNHPDTYAVVENFYV